MAQAQKAQPQTSSRSPAGGKQPPGWIWLILGVSIGLLVAFLTYLVVAKPKEDIPINDSKAVTSQPAPPVAANPAPTKAETPPVTPTEPRFSFYTELSKMKVEIPAAEIESLDEKPTKAASPITHTATITPPLSTPTNHTPHVAESLTPPTPAKPVHAYVLQVGSFKTHREAEQLKAKLALIGIEASIQTISINKSERMFRVRVGPYSNQNQANATKERLRQNQVLAIVLKLTQ